MDPRIVIAVVVIVAVVLWRRYRPWREAAANPEWLRQWRELPPADRRRIAREVRRGGVSDPHEDELAIGAARVQQQAFRFPLGVWAMLAAAAAVTLTMAVQGDLVAVPVGLVATGLLCWLLVHVHRTRRNLARIATVDADPPGEQA
jgi:Flp pilus assembly protein TadB